MTAEELKIQSIIKDTVYTAIQASKQENSSLVGDMKANIAVLQENHTEVIRRLTSIEAKQDRTNGSVINLRLWRSYTIGGLGIITMLVLPLTMYIFSNQVHEIQFQLDSLMVKK